MSLRWDLTPTRLAKAAMVAAAVLKRTTHYWLEEASGRDRV